MSWEILAEPIMTVMRYHNVENSYDIIKKATRGKRNKQDTIKIIINNCDLDKQ